MKELLLDCSRDISESEKKVVRKAQLENQRIAFFRADSLTR